jgi:hypothetical protein
MKGCKVSGGHVIWYWDADDAFRIGRISGGDAANI